jgi:dephospho-CoA kinase
LKSEGPVTTHALRDRIWDRQVLRRSVNRLMHPIILRELDRTGAEVVEIPLLLETCMQGAFPRVWVVTCGPEEQKRRLVQRLGDEAKAEAILSSQLPSDVKAVFADVIVRTNRPPEDVKRFVTAVAARLVQ